MSYTVKLSNGRTLTDLEQNGNLFIGATPVTRESFAGGLEQVVISGSGNGNDEAMYPAGTYRDMVMGDIVRLGTRYGFTLYTETKTESLEQLRADVDYVAIMTGVDL